VKLRHGWQAALDRLCGSAVPFDDSCFRSVELDFAHPDKVVSGEGARLQGGRFAAKGTRTVYGSLEDETATGLQTGILIGQPDSTVLMSSPIRFRFTWPSQTLFGSGLVKRKSGCRQSRSGICSRQLFATVPIA
jgi:hypothetical protein